MRIMLHILCEDFANTFSVLFYASKFKCIVVEYRLDIELILSLLIAMFGLLLVVVILRLLTAGLTWDM